MGLMRPTLIPVLLALLGGALFFIASSLTAFSQTTPIFTLSVNPEVVIAGEQITVTATPFNFSAASTTFTWFRDGVELRALSGRGRATTTLATNPEQSETIRIRVVADAGGEFERAEASVAVATLPNPAIAAETLRTIASDFTLEASDQYPAPGENVEVRVVTFAFDKQQATYRWSVNGAEQASASGRGAYRLALPAGKEGETATVQVSVATPGGDTHQKSIAIQTVSAPLYWWTQTSVPYWYRGKALPSLGSEVRVIALPNTPNVNQLTYRWQFNGGAIPLSSGIGKRVFSFRLAFDVSEEVSVTINDAIGAFAKTATVSINPVRPRVGIYEVRPLRGVISEAEVNAFSAPSGEHYDFLAAAFFFPPAERGQVLRYRWTVDGNELPGAASTPWLITLESRAGTEADSRIGVEVNDARRQPAEAAASFRAVLY